MIKRCTVVVVGPFPPPVHGASMNTAAITGELRRYCRVVVADISPRCLQRSPAYHAIKFSKVLRALLVILANWPARDRRLYTSSDAGMGVYYTAVVVVLARLLGYRVFVHHHSFDYINNRVLRMAVLARCAGREAVHIFLCPEMMRQFREHYPVSRKAVMVSNAGYIEPITHIEQTSFNGLRLGHLSNLGPEKGLDEVLELTRRLLTQAVKVRLVLAGPAMRPEDAGKIEAAITELGDALDYRGPVYGEDKDRFYRDIDVFLFPTRYVNEAQPNVILEAMSYGVPSISYTRGCIAGDLSRGGGVPVPTTEDFVKASLPTLNDWAGDRNALQAVREKALARANELKHEADRQIEVFLRTVAGSD